MWSADFKAPPRQVRGHRSGNQLIYVDSVLPGFLGEAPGEHPLARFPHAIGATRGGGTVTRSRSRVDNMSAAGLDQQRKQRARNKIDADEVERDVPNPFIGFALQDGTPFDPATRVIN